MMGRVLTAHEGIYTPKGENLIHDRETVVTTPGSQTLSNSQNPLPNTPKIP